MSPNYALLAISVVGFPCCQCTVPSGPWCRSIYTSIPLPTAVDWNSIQEIELKLLKNFLCLFQIFEGLGYVSIVRMRAMSDSGNYNHSVMELSDLCLVVSRTRIWRATDVAFMSSAADVRYACSDPCCRTVFFQSIHEVKLALGPGAKCISQD